MNEKSNDTIMREPSILRRFLSWWFSWRIIRRMLWGVAIMITLVALFYLVENLRGKYAWEGFKKEWEAKGEKFTLSAFVPPPVPEAQNLAMTPLLKSIFDYQRTTNGMRYNDTNGLARLEAISKGLDRVNLTELRLGSLDKGTFADLEATREFFRGNTNFPQVAGSGTAAQDIVTAMSKFDPQIKELLAASAERPFCRFPVSYEEPMPFNILLPHLGTIRPLIHVLQIRIVANLAAGHTGEAFEELKLSFRLAGSIQHEPCLISHLVRTAGLTVSLQSLREGLARHAWNEAQLSEIQKYLASQDIVTEFNFAMRTERAACLDGLEYFRRQGLRSDLTPFLCMATDGGNASVPLSVQSMALIPSGWFEQNKVTIARIQQKLYLTGMDAAKHRFIPLNEQEESRTIMETGSSPYGFFARVLLPALGSAASKSARMQTFLDEAQVACALERYRLTMGRYPVNLAELVPQIIAAIPNDMMDSLPLRYRVLPHSGYLVYSLGMNQVDDGGRMYSPSNNPSFGSAAAGDGQTLWTTDVKNDDWVWIMPGDYQQLLAPSAKESRNKKKR
ncbi:MAG: hypothetical protein WCO56_13530 [Verrucomicrobiota bacterium]